jgi:hypothetical protein
VVVVVLVLLLLLLLSLLLLSLLLPCLRQCEAEAGSDGELLGLAWLCGSAPTAYYP